QHQKGFTLIELLIVIGILAVLAVVVVLVLNPAELLRETRDSQRLSDLKTISHALDLYLADGKTFDTSSVCYAHASSSVTTCAEMGFPSATTVNANGSSSRAVDGSGWISLDFASITAGAPVSILPIDPNQSSAYFYGFRSGSSST